jgi:hypothetical protein
MGAVFDNLCFLNRKHTAHFIRISVLYFRPRHRENRNISNFIFFNNTAILTICTTDDSPPVLLRPSIPSSPGNIKGRTLAAGAPIQNFAGLVACWSGGTLHRIHRTSILSRLRSNPSLAERAAVVFPAAGTATVEEGAREVIRVELLGPDGLTGTFTHVKLGTYPCDRRAASRRGDSKRTGSSSRIKRKTESRPASFSQPVTDLDKCVHSSSCSTRVNGKCEFRGVFALWGPWVAAAEYAVVEMARLVEEIQLRRDDTKVESAAISGLASGSDS